MPRPPVDTASDNADRIARHETDESMGAAEASPLHAQPQRAGVLRKGLSAPTPSQSSQLANASKSVCGMGHVEHQGASPERPPPPPVGLAPPPQLRRPVASRSYSRSSTRSRSNHRSRTRRNPAVQRYAACCQLTVQCCVVLSDTVWRYMVLYRTVGWHQAMTSTV